jgi:hypothetical protein
VTPRSHGLRRRALQFSDAAVLAKDEVFAVCCTLADAERLLEAAAPSVGAAAAAARELLEARLAGWSQSAAAGSGSNVRASELTQ